jgi:hypothetical protein
MKRLSDHGGLTALLDQSDRPRMISVLARSISLGVKRITIEAAFHRMSK